MTSAVGDLIDRAERVGAALVICDDQNRIVRVNREHAQIYGFVDYATQPKFDHFLWRCIENHKLMDAFVYQDPHEWIHEADRAREEVDCRRFVSHHTDGRVLLVCYEKIKSATNWWYQVRIDITQELKTRFRQQGVLFNPTCWDGIFAPLARSATTFTNVLEAMPVAAALIMDGGKLVDSNRALMAMLREGDGLTKVGDRVEARDATEQAGLLRRLASFFEPGKPQAPMTLRVSRHGSAQAYLVTVSPLFDQVAKTWDHGLIGMLTVVDPSAAPPVDPRLIAEFFGITVGEAEVALALGEGRSIAAIASQRGVQVNTIYIHIRRIIEKTGYGGPADIARRVADLATVFGSRRSGEPQTVTK